VCNSQSVRVVVGRGGKDGSLRPRSVPKKPHRNPNLFPTPSADLPRRCALRWPCGVFECLDMSSMRFTVPARPGANWRGNTRIMDFAVISAFHPFALGQISMPAASAHA
jgi:hypothetical protein